MAAAAAAATAVVVVAAAVEFIVVAALLYTYVHVRCLLPRCCSPAYVFQGMLAWQ